MESLPDQSHDQGDLIWAGSVGFTLPIPRPAPTPSIKSYYHETNVGRPQRTQTELNVNYFGANDGEIGILKYKTPFSKTATDPSSNFALSHHGTYVYDNSNNSSQNMSSPQHQLRGMTPPSALRPNNRASSPQNLSETFPNKRGSVVTIALPSAKVLEEKNDDDVLTDDDDTPRTKKTSLNENNEANKDDMKDILENNYEENKANDKTDDDENENDKKTKEDDEEKNIINDRTIEDQIDDKSQLNIVDTNMIMKEKSILNSNEFAVPPGSPPGSREVPKRSHLITPPPSSFSDDNLKSSDQLTTNPPKSSESISPTNQINRSSQIRSHVVVPSVPFLPPQPSSMSFDIDLGPSRGTNPATQSPLK